jgi:6-hydroxycyclohex-1-ene-1-carbonyl-CoA dehydrogenase
VFIGSGGIGGFGVQIASALGARVAALDIDESKLSQIGRYGADCTIDVSGKEPRDVRRELRDFAKKEGLPAQGWKIFETSGTHAGQELAWSLLNHTATLAVVGFTMQKVELRLSNLMAFDATAFGTWGARPAVYPKVLDLLALGRITLSPFTKRYPMSALNELTELARQGALRERPVLIPDF